MLNAAYLRNVDELVDELVAEPMQPMQPMQSLQPSRAKVLQFPASNYKAVAPKAIARLLTFADVTHIASDLHGDMGWFQLQPDYQWIWGVVEPDNTVSALLIASPCHGLVFLARLAASKLASRYTLVRLFRKALADCRDRGYKAYWTALDMDKPNEHQLVRIITRARGAAIGKGIIMAGETDLRGL